MIFKTNFSINSIATDLNSIAFFCDKSVIIKNSTNKEHLLEHNALGGSIRNRIIFYFTEDALFCILKVTKKLCDKKNLDFVLFLTDSLLVVSETEIKKYNYTGMVINSFKFISRGVCVRSILFNNIYLAFENGSICYIEKNELIEIIKMDDNITSFDITEDKICISFFQNKLCVCDKSGDNFLYTELPFVVKTVRFWQGFIVSLDEENNFSLFDLNLQIVYTENYEDRLKNFEICGDVLYLIMKDNIVISADNIKEYI